MEDGSTKHHRLSCTVFKGLYVAAGILLTTQARIQGDHDVAFEPPAVLHADLKQLSKLNLHKNYDASITNSIFLVQKTNMIGNSLYPSQGWKLDEEFNHYKWTSEEWTESGETGLVYGKESERK